jgi:hypothetical protein
MNKMAIQAVPFVEKLSVEFSNGRLFRRMDLAREAFEFDAVINLAKLKTHTQMVLTLAVKNLFGTVIGTDKASWHLRAGKDVDCFATVLVQIFEKIRPVLSIVDGILAMEGNGPNSGDARHVGILGAPPMPWRWIRHLQLVGFKVRSCSACHRGEQGVGVADGGQIRRVGDDLDGFPLKDFKAPKSVTMA